MESLKLFRKLLFLVCFFCNLLYANSYEKGMIEYKNGNEKKALELFRESCKKDNLAYCYEIAKRFYKGQKLKKNSSYAKEFFEISCNNGISNACSNLGYLFLNEKKYLKALDIFKIGCNERKFFSDCEIVTMLYEKGIGQIKRDIKKSNKYLIKACDNGSYKFCSHLGNKLYMGKEIQKDYKKAFKLFDKACTYASINESCMMKGYFYFLGYGVKQDYLKAEIMFKDLCKNGYEEACKALKSFYKEIDIKTNKSYLISKQEALEKQKEKNYAIDLKTHLMWQDDIDSKTIKKNYNEAVKYCNNLILGGFNDWRLPNGTELKSLLDKNSKTKTILIIKNYGLGTYWSSSVRTKNDTLWCINFEHSVRYAISLDNPQYIRCVRGEKLSLDTLKFYNKSERSR